MESMGLAIIFRCNMSIKLIIFTLIFFLSLTFISACKYSKIFIYEHEPSKEFYKTFNFNQESSKKFKSNNVLFTIDVKEITPGEYIAWLGLYSDLAGKIIFLQKAKIESGLLKHEAVFNEFFRIENSVPNKNLNKTAISLFKINGSELQEIYKNNKEVILKINYTDTNDSINKEMIFQLNMRIKKHTIFPT